MRNSKIGFSRIAAGTVSTIALATVLSASGTAAAQQGDAADNTNRDTVIVTARRREESLQDVPASIDVFGSADLEEQGVFDFSDLAFRSPNVAIFENTNNPARTGVTIRGVPGRAGIYVDDVFVGDDSGYSSLLVDIERVEIVRGPQTTLFGRDALSGAINTVTKKPGNELEANFLGRYGAYDYAQIGGSISGPLTESISAKISGGYRSQDSFDEVRGFGSDFKTVKEYIIQGQLNYEVADNFNILLSGDYLKNDQVTGLSDVSRDFPAPAGVPAPANIYRIGANDGDGFDRVLPGLNVLNRFDREVISGYARIEWDLGDFDIRSITAIRDNQVGVLRDGDGSPFDLIRGQQPVDFRQITQELTVFYDNGSNFSAQLGAFYYDGEREFVDSNDIGDDFQATFFDPATLAFLDGLTMEDLATLAAPLAPGGLPGNITFADVRNSPFLQGFDPTLGAIGAFPNGNQTTFAQTDLRSIAVYGQASWRPLDPLEVTAGLRYTNERNVATIGFESSGLVALLAGPSVPPITGPAEIDNIITPSGSVKYDINDNLNVYFTAGQGFRSGGFNTAPPSPTETPADFVDRVFDPEKVTSWEVGFKSVLADGRVRVNAAGFLQDYKDFQRSFTRIETSGARITTTENTTASMTGGEIDLSYDVTDNFTLTAAYGYTNSEYDDFQTSVNTAGVGAVVVDLTGTSLPFVPKHTANITASYKQDIANGWAARIGGDAQYRSAYQVTDGGRNLDDLDAMTSGTFSSEPEIFNDETFLLNANLGIVNEDMGLAVTGRVFNITNEVYRTGVDFNTFVGAVYQGLSTPRTWTIEITKSF